MIRPAIAVISTLILSLGSTKSIAPTDASVGLSYTASGEMKFPVDYREWVYLTSGLDMSYTASTSGDHQMFDNVFVTPASYQEFKKTGTWPDKTVFALEVRGSEQKVSINKRGHSQGDVMGVEVHVKDAKLPGGFGFFEFDPEQATAKIVPQKESCYTCHQEHAAVDTTFVQFYPTLMPIAKEKKTLSPAYLKEIAEPKN